MHLQALQKFDEASMDGYTIRIRYTMNHQHRVRADLEDLIPKEKIIEDLRLNHKTDFYEDTLRYQVKSNAELTVHIEFKSEDARQKVGCHFKNKLPCQFSL